MNTQFLSRLQLPTYWRLATIRCSIYAIVVGWGAFQTGVEGYNAFSEMTQMQFYKFVGNIAIAMLGVWLAFLDQTMSAAKGNQTPPPTV